MAYSLDDSWDNCTPVARAGNACFGLYTRCGIWVARNLTDGYIPGEIAAAYGSPEQARKLVDVGLWETAEGGYLAPDYLTLNPGADKVRQRRASGARRQALFRDPDLRDAVRRRDKDLCRYCGVKVRWADRKGNAGGTYDHIDPDGGNTVDNVVVSCRGCTSAKRDRTPEAAGMTLRPAPTRDLVTNQNGSKSVTRSKPVSARPHIPPSKEGEGAAPPAPQAAQAGAPDNPSWRTLPDIDAPRRPPPAAARQHLHIAGLAGGERCPRHAGHPAGNCPHGPNCPPLPPDAEEPPHDQ